MKIKYIMSEVQDFSVLFNNLAHPVIYESWHFTRNRKTFTWPHHFIKRGGFDRLN